MVYISCSGGLGDIIQTYLSNPANPEGNNGDNRFPSSDPTMSLWFRRLSSFKEMHPDVNVRLVVMSHNPHTQELFEYHPHISDIEVVEWDVNTQLGDRLDEKYGKMGCIHAAYNSAWNSLRVSQPVIYLSDVEHKQLGRIVGNGEYVLIHPFAGAEIRMPLGIGEYLKIAKRIIRCGMNVVVVGESYIKNCKERQLLSEYFDYKLEGLLSLVNVASVRLTAALAMHCSGFVGTLSSMILPAWYSRVKSVCILGTKHDTGIPMEDFIADPNPSGWGLTQPFNKTFMIEHGGAVDTKEVVSWLFE